MKMALQQNFRAAQSRPRPHPPGGKPPEQSRILKPARQREKPPEFILPLAARSRYS